MATEIVPDFPNEVNPNPVTALDLQTEQGLTIRWAFDPPIQQARIFWLIGELHRKLGVDLKLELPELDLEPDDDGS